MGSPPCLKKAMLTVTVILNKNGLTVQCCVCVHRPMCCAALKNDNPSPPNPYISEMAFSCRFQKVYTYPPPGDDMFARGSKSCRNYRKVPKPTKLAGSECPREILWPPITNMEMYCWLLEAIDILSFCFGAISSFFPIFCIEKDLNNISADCMYVTCCCACAYACQ